ncbi:hypothetical protein J2W56_006649 [Nocardia kruczakiae]|uniref:Type III secretion system (T3SS) SseB-like protein n=1 Tax=Nocardia kruczakiae TaxID=261477 RepID=A0ABU1XQS7_9NOCA|nr:hypothetical protein [Nocardia kruczakiae]MDR7172883.1 hypothetical protein [Nocardia kruczakiae]
MLSLTDTMAIDHWAFLPEPTAAERDWARANPGKWKYFADPAIGPAAATWPTNIMSGWGADENGELSQTWLNPDFVPAPETAEIEFANELELVLWRTARGFSAFGPFIDVLSRSQLLTIVAEDDSAALAGEPPLTQTTSQLVVYTSPARLPNDVNPWLRREVSGRDILEHACSQPGFALNIHSGSESPTIPSEDLADLWRQWCALDGHGNEDGNRP